MKQRINVIIKKAIVALAMLLTTLLFSLVFFNHAPHNDNTSSNAASTIPNNFLYVSGIVNGTYDSPIPEPKLDVTITPPGKSIDGKYYTYGTNKSITITNNSSYASMWVFMEGGNDWENVKVYTYIVWYRVNGGQYRHLWESEKIDISENTTTTVEFVYAECTYDVISVSGGYEIWCRVNKTVVGEKITVVHYPTPSFYSSTTMSKTAVWAKYIDGTATYTHNGTSKGTYVSGTSLTDEGKYVITLKYSVDGTQYTDTRTLIKDSKAPALNSSAPNKTSASASWSVGSFESAVTATYTHNGTSKGAYTSGMSLTNEGKYVITATDEAGNSSSVTLYVDRTAPTLNTTAPSKESVKASWSVGSFESAVTATYTLNGTSKGAYSSGSSLTAEGKYVITATDEAGNSSSVTLYVDKTAPSLTATAPNKTSASASWSVGSYESAVTATYTYNGMSKGTYTNGTGLTAEGKYVVTATDEAGNSSSVTLYVDKTAPTLTATAPSKESVKASWSVGSNESAVTATYTYNGTYKGTYSSGSSLTSEGMYVITATDEAGNSSTATLYVDKTAPSLNSSAPSKTSASANWSVGRYESAVTATYVYISATETSKTIDYTSGSSLTAEGKYIITATDEAGNSSTATLYVDKTAPSLNSSAPSRTSVRASWSVLSYESAVTATYTYNGTSKGTYSSDSSLTDEGKYVVTATDEAGNSSSVTLYVDKTAPSLTATAPSKTNVRASWSVGSNESAVTATYTLQTASGMTSPVAYASGKSLTDEGKYVVTATDEAGNSSTATLYVDRTAPSLTATAPSNTSVQASWSESSFESAVTVMYTLQTASGTTSPIAYASGKSLTDEGKYVVTATDEAGNSSSVTLYVDRTAPSLNAAAPSKTSVKASWTTVEYESAVTATYTLQTVSGTTLPIAYTSGRNLTDEGKYVVTVIDEAGNSSTATLYVDRTAPSLNATAPNKASVQASWSKSSFESAVTATYVYTSASSTSDIIDYSSGTRFTNEGKYVITATDAAGNSSSVTLYVDKTAPTLNATAPSKVSVSAKWNVGNFESAVTATYVYTSATGTSEVIDYTSGLSLTAEGKYIITATDEAGNSSTVTLYVDRTAPTLTSCNPSKDLISTSWTNYEHESAITATYTLQTSSSTSSPITYSPCTQLTAEGKYIITATDAAGNSASVTLYVDRTAPALTSSSLITRTSTSTEFTYASYETEITASYTCDNIDLGAYKSRQVLSTEGDYIITATDAAGNSSTLKLIVDKTSPILKFASNNVTFERYTSNAFLASAFDERSGVDVLEILNGSTWTAYDYLPRSESGVYSFRLADKAGNVTTAIATVYKTETFGNCAKITDGYKLNAWYIVTLPARIFTTASKDIAGRYSFDTYEKALAFAIASEREFRVSEVQGGYMYVSPTNEVVSQKYTDEATLNATITKYAKNYLSSRQTAAGNGTDKYYTEKESLTRNTPTLPDFLSNYNNLPCHFMHNTVTFSLPNISYIADMPYYVTATYLGDFERATGDKITVPVGKTLREATGEKYRQGWYLVEERDEAGNIESYLVYSDAELPTVQATLTTGNGTKEATIDYAYTQNEAMYYLTFGIDNILDNADTYLTIKLERGNSVWYFTQDDTLPILGSDDYTSGKYTVTLFDRSLNTLVFDVYIAGAAPSWSHTSLAADRTDCTVSFLTTDKYNVVTGIELYKIEYDGSRTVLDTDSIGTSITPATLSYVLTSGGKYGATIKDNYARTVEFEPIFFLKGLPNGTLSGTKDGGRTNKNVSFTFSNADVAEIYTLNSDGSRVAFSNYIVQNGATNTTYNITAGETTSYEYLVFLHANNDLSLFVEYTFEIDTILPILNITNSDGEDIAIDGATNKPFSLSWSETGVSVHYYTSKSGAIGTMKYSMGEELSSSTLYYFSLKDDVGNKLDFTVLLDNTVDYTLDGKTTNVDGVIYTNAPITLTVNEPTQEFNVLADNGATVVNGGAITLEGRYEITMSDNYNNTAKIIIVIDYTPPTISLTGTESGSATKQPVEVTAFDYNFLRLTDSRGNILRDVMSGEVFELSGRYYITASDYAGNTVTVTFSIDLGVDYTLSVPNGAVTSGKVSITALEELDITVTLNGELIEYDGKDFLSVGEYTLLLTDALGNTATSTFVILSSRVKTLDTALPLATQAVYATKDGHAYALQDTNRITLSDSGTYVITLDCGGKASEFCVIIDNTPPHITLREEENAVKLAGVDKEIYTLKLTRNGKNEEARIGTTLTEPGSYVLTITDDLGNTSVIEFVISYRFNTWAIVAIAVGIVALLAVLVLIIRARRKLRIN